MFVYTPSTDTCAAGATYEPLIMMNRPDGHLVALAQASNAPSSATGYQRRPVTLPSFVAAISVSMKKSRANAVVDRFSMRSSTHFTGRPVTIDATIAQM